MPAKLKNKRQHSSRGAAWVFFAVAGFAFLWGGRALSEFAGTERALAEMEGIAVAMTCGVVGVLAEFVGRRLVKKKR
jgi:hypothetical protein